MHGKTPDHQGWLRLIRKDGVIRASFWRVGRWQALPDPGISVEGPLFLGARSWNGWHDLAPSVSTVELVLEHLSLGQDVGKAYQPTGFTLLSPAVLPDIDLPDGVSAELYSAPFAVQSPFFGADGTVYLLPADRDERILIALAPEGTSFVAGEGDVFAGLNRKRGLWHDGALLVTVDLWRDGGNRLGGLYRVAPDGTTARVEFSTGLGGLSCLRSLQDGLLLQCDFEADGLWQGPATGGSLVNISGRELTCPQDAALSDASGAIYAVNNGASYSCDGRPGLYRLPRQGGVPQLVLAPEGEREFGGLVWTDGGLFGGGLMMADPNQGALLRIDEQGRHAVAVLSGLDLPGDMAAPSDGSALAIRIGDRQVLLLRQATDEPQTPVDPDGTEPVPPANPGKFSQGSQTPAVDPAPPVPTPPETVEEPVVQRPAEAEIPRPANPEPEPVWQPYGAIVTGSIDTIAAVQNGPTQPSEFRVAEPMLVVSVMTYHWNFGRGDITGTIGLAEEAGALVGRWAAEGSDGQGGVPNAYWHVYPRLVIPPGLYRIVDGKPETWATNAETGSRGVFRVELQRVRDIAEP